MAERGSPTTRGTGIGWSWRVATISSIPVYLHGTFLLLLVFVFVSDWARGRDLGSAAAGVLFMLAIFGTVVLHEFGHALMARRFGIRTRDITLLPIGGLARIERMPDLPRQELWVAIAGPAVNLVIAAAAFVLLALASPGPISLVEVPDGFLGRFLEVNVWLALFNLIPAFPMDGGRALRALLAERFDYVKATRIAAKLGQGLALLFGFAGLFSNPFLIFIALFVWMGASSEASTTETRSALAGVPVAHAMITDFRTLGRSDRIGRAVELVLATSQRDFPVMDEDRVVGILTRDAITATLAQVGPAALVGEAMQCQFQHADVSEMLETAFQRLQSRGCPMLPVLAAGRLVGVLTPENVAEYVLFAGAMRPARRTETTT